MKKEKGVTTKAEEVPGRLTRARAAAAALTESGQMPPLKGVAQENQKQVNPKRAVSDDQCLPRKKRPALQDTTNICCDENTKVQVVIHPILNSYSQWKENILFHPIS